MPCHHTWTQKANDVISSVNGVVTTRFTHECPACGRIKITVRASRKLPPEIKWRRELEKLMERAAAEGYVYTIATIPLLLDAVTVKEL